MNRPLILTLCTMFFASMFGGCAGVDTKTPNTLVSSAMPIYVTPFYDSNGPKVSVGQYSQQLENADASTILQLSAKFAKERDKLRVEQMFVMAIRLFDLGQKDEAVYWFYSAQYRGRLFSAILDQDKAAGIGSPEFELPAAFASFNALAGDYINSYAFGDVPKLEQTLAKVEDEGKSLPEMEEIYPKVHFIAKDKWSEKNERVSKGLAGFLSYVKANEDSIKQQRRKNGIDDKAP
jgi:hypothetical protein